MLDQMSGGRLELGVGRGVSPFETKAYGLDFANTGEIYHEAFQLILKGLASDELTFEGKHYQFRNVPMILRPVQRPHPPLWYGTTIPENADWPAANDVNIVTIALRPTVRVITDRYRAVRAKLGKAPTGGPLVGVARHVVVADTDEAALEIARRAYPRWRNSFRWLFARHGVEPRIAGLYPPTFDELAAPRQWRRGIAPHGARLRRGRARGEREQLPAVMVRVRRHDAFGIAALGRTVFARRDAGIRQRARRRRGMSRQFRCHRRDPAGADRRMRCRRATFNRRRRGATLPRAPSNPWVPWRRPWNCAASARSSRCAHGARR